MHSEDPPFRFIADVMLGRLAKWLRIIGYDVLYDNSITDSKLVDTALREDRIILTRDRKMLQRRKVKKHIHIQSDFLTEQLHQVLQQLAVSSFPRIFTRCLACNSPLKEIDKDAVRERVPAYVYRTQEQFMLCPACDKIYWAGTHREGVLKRLEKLNT